MLTIEYLLDSARNRTGLANFGGDDFIEPLEILLNSINQESRFTAVGNSTIEGMLTTYLANRLEVESWYSRHPEIDEQEIVAPTFITGLPRSGSTALGGMMAQDPNTRSLRAWESTKPCPPPDASTASSDPRIARYAQNSKSFEGLVPRLRDTLPRDIHGPDECLHVLNMSLAGWSLSAWAHIPSYMKWVIEPSFDAVPAYRYHKRVLKLLQWRSPPHRWVLRAPVHMLGVEALGTVYPDAKFIITHRDPVKAVVSVTSLMSFLRQAYLSEPELRALGREMMDLWETGLQRLLAFRDRIGEDRFHDMSHTRQKRDAAGQIADLYARLGWPFSADLRARIESWIENHPKGSHWPDPATFGLDLGEIKDRFSFYADRHGQLF
jgi:hypothetical protein